MDPSVVGAWVKIFRDVVIVGIAGFMLVHEAAYSSTPNALIVGAALTLLGIPPALRLDDVFRGKGKRG